jgi:hypothetical protein
VRLLTLPTTELELKLDEEGLEDDKAEKLVVLPLQYPKPT